MNVSLHVWRVPATELPGALWRVATGPRRVRRLPGVHFVKLLGTGRGHEFGPTRADVTRWAALTVSDGPPPEWPEWARRATASCRIDLAVLRVRGRWAGREPFPQTTATAPGDRADAESRDAESGDAGGGDAAEGGDSDRPVLVLTRARLRPARTVTFWRAVAPVASALAEAPGLLTAFGIGEAPLGWQGTISVWRSAPDLARFAYRHPQHRRAIEQTAANRWYAEELFARFAVLDMIGDTGVIGWDTTKQ